MTNPRKVKPLETSRARPQPANRPRRASLNPALRSFWKQRARNRVLYGGRSSSKSWDAAGHAVFLAQAYKVRFLCVRQFQNKIAESVYTLLKIQIERFGLTDEFDITDNRIRHKVTGSEFVFYGLWRHIDEIKSLEGIDICWIEEAHNLTADQWKVLEPTVRAEGSEFWIIFNPRLTTDFVYRRFVTNTPPDTVKRKINYDENPFLSNTIVRVIEAAKAEDEDEYRHVYLGEPQEDDDKVIIRRSWVLAAINARQKLKFPAIGRRRIGFDIADGGADKCATVEVLGIEAVGLDEWKATEDQLLKSVSRVHAMARQSGATVDYDCIGVGAFAGAHFNELNALTETDVEHHKFNAGGAVIDPDERIDENPNSPTNKDYYSNIKAQVWWDVARRFRNTYNAVHHGHGFDLEDLISISPNIPDLDGLIDELCTPRRDFDNAGRVKVESKKDLANAKRVGGPVPSPNKADAFVMAYAKREDGAQAFMLLKRTG